MKRKWIFVLSFLIFVAKSAEAKDIELNMTRLDCTPMNLKAGDTLVLEFAAPHGEELAIANPDEQWFELIFSTAIKKLRIDTKTTEGNIDGEVLPVFTKSGKYVIQMGNDFDSEDPDIQGYCQVNFKR